MSFLDTIATLSTRYALFVWILCMVLGVVLSKPERAIILQYPNNFRWVLGLQKVVLGFLIFVFLFPAFLNSFFFGLGYSIFPLDAYVQDGDTLWYEDHLNVVGGRYGTPLQSYRFHALDLRGGEKLSRSMAGNELDVVGFGEGKVWTKRSDFALYSDGLEVYDMKTGKRTAILNKRNLADLDEFKNGIQSFEILPKQGIIHAKNKLGEEFWIDPETRQFVDKNTQKNFRYFEQWNGLLYKTESDVSRFVLTGESRKYLADARGKKLNEELLLDGEILKILSQPERIITLNYPTTDHKSFLIKAFDFQGNKKWEVDPAQLQTNWFTDPLFSSVHIFSGFVMHEGSFVGLGGGYAFSVDTENGKIVWKTRL